ncbi:hypothetical protein BC826DRAFT_1113269 [Russula brevipes]|nr:hypothetical protein BC826DRAFT_1113269 [Russula brevipes]
MTHDAHQCNSNMCNLWITHLAHASASRGATLIEAGQQRDAVTFGRLQAERAESRQPLRAAHATMGDFRHDHDALRDRLGRADYDNEYLCDHTPRHRKDARRHGSSPSPSCTPSRPASPTQEDPVTDPLQPTLPFPLRAATDPRSSAQLSDAPPISSLMVDASSMQEVPVADPLQPTLPFPLRGAANPRSSVQPSDAPPVSSLTVDASGNVPVPPTPAAFAPTPFLPSVGFSSPLPVLCLEPVELLHAAVESMQLHASSGLDFDAHQDTHTQYAFAVAPGLITLACPAVLFSQLPLTTRAACTIFSLHGVVPSSL